MQKEKRKINNFDRLDTRIVATFEILMKRFDEVEEKLDSIGGIVYDKLVKKDKRNENLGRKGKEEGEKEEKKGEKSLKILGDD